MLVYTGGNYAVLVYTGGNYAGTYWQLLWETEKILKPKWNSGIEKHIGCDTAGKEIEFICSCMCYLA
jgi:hypothetical protein